MNHILDHIGIYVNDESGRYVYKRIFDKNGIPNYFPPGDKNSMYTEMYIDEILFLPIELDTFNTDRENKFFGFQYLFNSSGHTTVSLGPDPLKLGETRLQITAEVRRVRYYMKDELDIVIDKICDPLYPPRLFNVSARSSAIGTVIQDLVGSVVAGYNDWYLDRHV